MAALFTVLCGLAALCLGYFIHFFATGNFVYSTEAVLDSRLSLVEVQGAPPEGIHGEYIYQYLNDDGTLPAPAPSQIQRFSEGMIVFDHPENDRRYAAKIYSFDDGQRLLIGFDITHMSRDFRLMQIMGIK